MSFFLFLVHPLGQGKDGDQEAQFSTRARRNQIHGPLCQKCHWRISKSQALQKYPHYNDSPWQLFPFPVSSFAFSCILTLFLDSLAPPSELLEMCELSLEKMGAIFADTNVYMLHMMYQAMGVCLYMQDWDGAMSYGEKIVYPYR